MNANRTSGCEHPCKSAGRMFFEFSCKFKKHPGRIALQSDIAEELHMEGDAARIHQLVSLLVDNAVKYTPEGGKIHIFWRKNGKKAEFSVQNTCDTLPEGDLNRLFDRFYRADASRARESGGYGIGLSVAAASIAKALDIESKGITLLSPVFDLDFGQEAMASAMLGLSKILGIPKPFCAKALLSGAMAVRRHTAAVEKQGKALLATLKPEDKILVLITRNYGVSEIGRASCRERV